jgi:hypothetical protein
MEEDFKKQAEQLIDSLLFDYVVPSAYTLVEYAHSCQQIIWFLLIIVRTT